MRFWRINNWKELTASGCIIGSGECGLHESSVHSWWERWIRVAWWAMTISRPRRAHHIFHHSHDAVSRRQITKNNKTNGIDILPMLILILRIIKQKIEFFVVILQALAAARASCLLFSLPVHRTLMDSKSLLEKLLTWLEWCGKKQNSFCGAEKRKNNGMMLSVATYIRSRPFACPK